LIPLGVGPNGTSPRHTDGDAKERAMLGFFNGNVVKSKESEAAKGPRPIHVVDRARAGTPR
jgi:hypothetical protein